MALGPRLPYKTEYTGTFEIPATSAGQSSLTKFDSYIRLYTASKAELVSKYANKHGKRLGKVVCSTATVSRVGNSNTILISEKFVGGSTDLEGEIQPNGSISGVTIQHGVDGTLVRGGHFKLAPTASALDVDEDAELVAKQSLSLAKVTSGLIRLVSEDMYNGGCQLIYLCKIWNNDEVGMTQKAFVISSVAAGFACSLSGPIQESFALYRLRAQAPVNPTNERRYTQLQQGTSGNEDFLLVASEPSDGKMMRPNTKSLAETLFESNTKKSVRSYRLLLAAACSYWGSLVAVYFLVEPKCDGGAPKLAWNIFLVMTMCSTLVQIWVLVQGRNGYLLFKQCQPVVLLSIMFENLGRYDSFGDVANAVTIRACSDANPEFYSWFSIYGHKFNLPTTLGNMVTLGLVFILVMQALPGLILLSMKKWYTVALKLNELCVILNAIAREAYENEQDDDLNFDEDGNFRGDAVFPVASTEAEVESDGQGQAEVEPEQ